jgi:cob(I)alamin adenosyltransferase
LFEHSACYLIKLDIMKIYTRKGDKGQTSLFGGTRLPKAHIRIEAYGTVDELNSQLGVVMGYIEDAELLIYLQGIQSRLFDIGAILAADPSKDNLFLPELKDDVIEEMEAAIDRMNEELPELKHFILPSGNVILAQCHVARTVCRRAERAVVRLAEVESVPEIIIRYLNRLSDYLFVLARYLGKQFDVPEVKWIP